MMPANCAHIADSSPAWQPGRIELGFRSVCTDVAMVTIAGKDGADPYLFRAMPSVNFRAFLVVYDGEVVTVQQNGSLIATHQLCASDGVVQDFVVCAP